MSALPNSHRVSHAPDIDHQTKGWRDVVITYNAPADTVIVTEREKLRAVLDRKRGTFWTDTFPPGREVAITE
jgi:hypothetical protein